MHDQPGEAARLLALGHGYVAARLAETVRARGWHAMGTTRSAAKAAALAATGIEPLIFDGGASLPASVLASVTHILVSIPPGNHDPALALVAPALAALQAQGGKLRWLGYLSTTGVYGDAAGGWVDEETPAAPGQARSVARLAAEQGWLALQPSLPVHVFRLPGIYGPGRSVIDELRAGTARRIVKPGQFFSRIHVDDIVAGLCASMAAPNPGRIYNLADDEPAPSSEVVAHAAALLGMVPPPEQAFADIAPTLSPMARSFYAENRRVRNERMKKELNVRLTYPTYREGLAGILRACG